MDPAPFSTSPDWTGFPRPRGDGPTTNRDSSMTPPVSPPTRDGPQREKCRDVDSRVSPPTRGWTLLVYEIKRSGDGFPAHAGWTLGLDHRADLAAGFPAHAGMDPIRPRRTSLFPRFPRPRGDGPDGSLLWAVTFTVSPAHAGWTAVIFDSMDQAYGFPAHAGMDRQRPRRAKASGWFPRPRGDGPSRCGGGCAPGWVSPPTRGWTGDPQVGLPLCLGFPAHAGMDPNPGSRRTWKGWFPRPRGDGPHLLSG